MTMIDNNLNTKVSNSEQVQIDQLMNSTRDGSLYSVFVVTPTFDSEKPILDHFNSIKNIINHYIKAFRLNSNQIYFLQDTNLFRSSFNEIKDFLTFHKKITPEKHKNILAYIDSAFLFCIRNIYIFLGLIHLDRSRPVSELEFWNTSSGRSLCLYNQGRLICGTPTTTGMNKLFMNLPGMCFYERLQKSNRQRRYNIASSSSRIDYNLSTGLHLRGVGI